MPQHHSPIPAGHAPGGTGSANAGVIGVIVAAILALVGGTAVYLNPGSQPTTAPATAPGSPTTEQTPTGRTTHPGEPPPSGKSDKSTKPKPPPPDPG